MKKIKILDEYYDVLLEYTDLDNHVLVNYNDKPCYIHKNIMYIDKGNTYTFEYESFDTIIIEDFKVNEIFEFDVSSFANKNHSSIILVLNYQNNISPSKLHHKHIREYKIKEILK